MLPATIISFGMIVAAWFLSAFPWQREMLLELVGTLFKFLCIPVGIVTLWSLSVKKPTAKPRDHEPWWRSGAARLSLGAAVLSSFVLLSTFPLRIQTAGLRATMNDATLIREPAETVRHDPEERRWINLPDDESLYGLNRAFLIGTTVYFPITEVTTSGMFSTSDASGTAYFMVRTRTDCAPRIEAINRSRHDPVYRDGRYHWLGNNWWYVTCKWSTS